MSGWFLTVVLGLYSYVTMGLEQVHMQILSQVLLLPAKKYSLR
jgi:hypothetical protein